MPHASMELMIGRMDSPFCACRKNFTEFICLGSPVITQRLQKDNWVIKKCVLVKRKKIGKMTGTEGRKPAEY